MANFKQFLRVGGLLLAATFVVSCQESMEDSDHYQAPSWLKGNAYEVLQKEGNHQMFLQAAELTGYRPIIDGKSILTVMAPDDNAFTAYLQENGFSSVEEMNAANPVQLKNAIGYHLMYYAYDWDKLVNFRPSEGDGATDEQKEQDAGMWFKHRTHSADAQEQVRGKVEGLDTTVTLYHFERFLPVLSNQFFATKGIDAKSAYEYFFPSNTWTTGTNKFCVANANVKDSQAVVTDNGYLYHINQFIRPLETIYKTLKQNPNYSDFVELYDQYSKFEEASTEISDNIGHTVYIHTHNGLPNIACEWPVTDYKQMSSLSRTSYNIFAPSNKAIASFFTNYWTAEGGYGSLKDLDPLILQYFILQSFANEKDPIFPEDIRSGRITTAFGSPLTIDPDKVADRLFCENGVVYGMDEMEAPAVFSSVVGAAFCDTTYLGYLYTLDKSELVLSLASDKIDFVALIPSNKQYMQNEPAMRINVTSAGKQIEVYSDVNAVFDVMSGNQAKAIVNMHTASNVSALASSGIQVIETNTPFNYWFVNDGKITTNALFNAQLNPSYTGTPFVAFHELTKGGQGWRNGHAYTYDADGVFGEASGDGLEHLLAVGNDKNYEYYLFAQLMQKAGLVNTKDNRLPSLAGEGLKLVAFVPTNDAIKANLSKIPGTAKLTIEADGTLKGTPTTAQKADLANYLGNYFVSSLMNNITAYPYPGSEFKGDYMTTTGATLQMSETSGQLQVGMEGQTKVNVIGKYFQLPFAFSDGCLQFIDGIFQSGE